ncbi:App1 family protein [uncultured Corynebacterium sp.]|uniref:App1 family protein n=1 Tax=uncultured Corynebacterium sp. TaxID=159447 RepID=UPI0025D43081|nr:phosphatase domain-containing protein [uncultured Corynebacterium sp.]
MALSDIARKVERTINRVGRKRKTAKGWRPAITGFSGYGSVDRVHVLGRVLMADPEDVIADIDPNLSVVPTRAESNFRDFQAEAQRGWRQFVTTQVSDHPVTVRVGDRVVQSRTNDNGYIDVLVEDHGLEPGWNEVTIEAEDAVAVRARVLIVEPSARVGLVSDIDDTVMVTWLPRAMLAAWNSWVRHTNTRKPVPGMAEFYQELLDGHPDAPIIYLSTGAWNTFETLEGFMATNGLPAGPMLLTDWGPTPTGMFRSGQEHKKVQLRNLFIDFPDITWILVGDDGQHDPLIYGDAVFEHPDRVAGVAIRQLSPSEHVLSHGTANPLESVQSGGGHGVPVIQGADGHELLANYRAEPFAAVEESKQSR